MSPVTVIVYLKGPYTRFEVKHSVAKYFYYQNSKVWTVYVSLFKDAPSLLTQWGEFRAF